MSRIRIGAVSFLNTRPLVHGLETSHSEYALSFDTPSNLAEKLRLEELEVGLIPVVEHFRGVGESFVPGIGIASDGPARTVKLYSRVPLESLRDVAVDARSRTSVALLRIVLAERFGVYPDFYSHRPDLNEMLRAHEAALLIGDMAFQDDGAPLVLDLGAAWKELTGLPFVFAVWTAREGVDLHRVGEWLRAARVSGLAHLDEIAAAAAGAGEHGQDAMSILGYFRDNLHYVLDERDVAGMETFRKLCVRYHLIPANVAPRVAVGVPR
jgi:chorismate dehydratase